MRLINLLIILIFFPNLAYAYIGPGLGLGAIITALTVLGLIILAFFGIIFYPLKKFYKKPCLLALSLFGNSLRRGRSIIIYLLNEKMDKVHSIEQIHLRDDLKLRHFVTNLKNELYEDMDGNIYISADKKGIYKLSFGHFRN